MERFLSREASSVRVPIDGKGYQRVDNGGGAVHVEGGQPFSTDTEAMERKLARQKKLLLKERISKFFYNEKGEPRPISALVAGILGIGAVIGFCSGFFYGIGRIAGFISFLDKLLPVSGANDFGSIWLNGSVVFIVTLSLLVVLSLLSYCVARFTMIVGEEILRCVKEKIEKEKK